MESGFCEMMENRKKSLVLHSSKRGNSSCCTYIFHTQILSVTLTKKGHCFICFPVFFSLTMQSSFHPLKRPKMTILEHKIKAHCGSRHILFCCSQLSTQSIFHFPAKPVLGTTFQNYVLKTGLLVCCMCSLAVITEGNQAVMATARA